MLPISFRPILFGSFAFLVVSCSSPQESAQTPLDENALPQFSEEDRLAAQVLSIANRGRMPEAPSPYEQALACSQAIETIVERLRQSGALTDQQMQAVEEGKLIYERRAQLLRGQADPAAGNVQAEFSNARGSPTLRDQTLFAMGCLQELDAKG